MENMTPILVVIWIACGLLGSIIGGSKDASGTGLFLGLLFGPLGVIATFAIDNREQCPHCGGRLAGKYRKCPNCGDEITSSRPDVVANPPVVSPEQPLEVKPSPEEARQIAEIAREAQDRRQRERERERERAADWHRKRNAKIAKRERDRQAWLSWWQGLSDQSRFLIVFWSIVLPLFVVVVGIVVIAM